MFAGHGQKKRVVRQFEHQFFGYPKADRQTKTQPSIIPDVDIIKYKGSEVAEFSVQEFPIKPVAFKGRYFKRVKNSNHQLSPVEISHMSMASLQVSWDAHPAPDFTVQDIDFGKVTKFIDRVNRVGRFKTPSLIIDDKMLRLTLFDAVEETQKYLVYQAYARNKLISEAFYLTGDIEKYGSGFRRIRNEINNYPTMELACEEVPNGFLATISYVNQKISTANDEGIGNGGLNGGLNEEEINLLLMLIEEHPNQRIPFFVSKLNVPERTVERWVKKLRNEGRIIYKGAKRTGGYWKAN